MSQATGYVNELPEDYSYLYGPERPFAPSLARTSTGGAFDDVVNISSDAPTNAGDLNSINGQVNIGLLATGKLTQLLPGRRVDAGDDFTLVFHKEGLLGPLPGERSGSR